MRCLGVVFCATKIRLESGADVLESSDDELKGTYATYAEFDPRTPPDAVAPTYSEAGQTIGVHANRDTVICTRT